MSPRTGRANSAGLVLAVLVQLAVLYAPAGTTAAPFPHADKVVHVAVFLVPVALAVLATRRPLVVAAVFILHAAVSEVVQATLLPQRSGDPRDAVADVVGVGLGVLVAHLVRRSPERRPNER